jgi:DNA invertase Pin-like site-specific DNA recombinase
MNDKIDYIPPLVSCNNLSSFADSHKTLGKSGLSLGGYIRISTKKEAQLTSIENQKKILKEWANINGYNLTKFYIDIKSGSFSYLRNEMQLLKQDVKSKVIEGVIAKEISRTSRDIMDILELKRNLESHGAFFISIKENYDSRTDDDEFLLIIYAALAQKERKTTAGRVKITQMLKAREGKTNVPSPAFGYKLSSNKQHLVIDNEKAKIYRLIVEKFLDGWGQLKICKWLNQEGVLPKRAEHWHTNTIKSILINPVYLGTTIYNATTLIRDSSGKQKRVVRPQEEWIVRHNTHPPLITLQEYNQIIDLIEQRKKKFCKEWTKEKKYLLSGILYCSICKGKIYGGKQTSPNKLKYFYYYVDQNRYGICNTKTKYWNMERVDNSVLTEIKNFFKDKNLITKIITEKYIHMNKNINDNHLKYLKTNLNSILIAIKKQQEAYEKDIISIDEYSTRMKELRNQKKEFTEKINLINKVNENGFDSDKKLKFIIEKVLNTLENLEKADYNVKEFIVTKLIKSIEISKDYSIKIHFTFE